jgi:hypothetical protein
VDSVGPETLGIHAVVAAPERVEVGLQAGDDAPRPELVGLRLGDHLEVFESMPTARHRRSPELLDNPPERVDHGGDGGVADHVEAGRDTRFGA